jgi:low affinity Fe/Cu permease
MNKLTDFQKRMFVLGVGLLMVLIGVGQALFKIEFLIKNQMIINEGTTILMLIAAVLLFSIKRKPKQEPTDQNKMTDQIRPEEVKENQSEKTK